MLGRDRPRIGWNLLSVRREALGGWLYTKALIEAVSAHSQGARLVAFVTAESRPLVEHLSSTDVVDVRVNSDLRTLRIVAEHTRVPSLARLHGVDCLHNFAGTAPRVTGVATALTVFDLLVFHRPEVFAVAKRLYLRQAVPASIRRADVVLPMSEATATDVRQRFPIDESRVVVIPPVVDDSWYPPARDECNELRQSLGLPMEFWLYVANGYPHKNHEALLRALACMRSGGVEPWPLVLRGSDLEPRMRRAAELGVADLVRVIPQVDQSRMRALYGTASACVFPSDFEGGGLPALEAMACAAPLLASDIPTNREFLATYAERFDPHDAQQLADAMVRMQRTPPDHQALALASRAQLRSKRPQAVAHTLLAAYDSAIARAAFPSRAHPRRVGR